MLLQYIETYFGINLFLVKIDSDIQQIRCRFVIYKQSQSSLNIRNSQLVLLFYLAPPSPNFSLPQPQYSTQITEVISTEIFLNSSSPNRSRRTSVEAKNFHSTHLRKYTNIFTQFRGFFYVIDFTQ